MAAMGRPRIALLQAQVTPEGSGLRNEKWYLPLGLLSIARFLQQGGHNDVEILDMDHDHIDSTLTRLTAGEWDVVGVNFNVFNTGLLDEVVKAAKEGGSLTVIGGQAATAIPDRLLSSNDDIDAVVLYDGEEPMLQLANRLAQGTTDLSRIPNLVWRNEWESKNQRNSQDPKFLASDYNVRTPDISSYPMIDRRINGFDLDRYKNYWYRTDIDPDRVPTSMYIQKGCGNGCTFCARIDKQIRQRTPKQVYEELQVLHNEGVNYVYIVDDAFTADKELLREIKNIFDYKGHLPIKFWCFADVRDLDEECVELLSAIHMEKVLIGIESGSEEVRKKSGKRFSNEFLFRRLEYLAKAKIKLEDSYVLGLAGETEETLLETFKLSQKVASICQTEDTAFNIMTPLPGSPDWNRLMSIPQLRQKYAYGYHFDIDEVRNDFFEAYCSFPAEDVWLAKLA
ncbi:MAG: hypothetical protein A3G18_00790 [Rhodospirillales bacterium RIFCSPLOWO2_12_FULL_58_28]|nr:MAG: hypothetical protein A3H92_12635 [Rhodospirillales bacterium RIFCSPLOWO2_02_FULL_58_16]OHC77061.1 MAG: hypothetical protein A3G18_00790 [Rhodospirillales bacterium RIFCSPLOWO2_12_FULL_58_28]